MGEPMALRLHDGNDRDELFLCLLRIKFWVLNLSRKRLDNPWILSYNTTPADEGQGSSLLLVAWFSWPHVYHPSVWGWPHMLVGMFLLCSRHFSSLPAERFLSASTARKQDHMTIILDSDLTTSLTIVRCGLRGDSSTREHENARFSWQNSTKKH